MNNKYNILVTYSGDDEFRFMIKRIGEVSITRTRPIYIYNADVDTINTLRLLRRMLIEITIGAKPEGAYKIYNMDDYSKKDKILHRDITVNKSREEILDNAEIKSILRGSTGPIIEETVVEPVIEEPVEVEVEEIKVEEPAEVETTEEPETPKKEEVIKPVKKSNKKSKKSKKK